MSFLNNPHQTCSTQKCSGAIKPKGSNKTAKSAMNPYTWWRRTLVLPIITLSINIASNKQYQFRHTEKCVNTNCHDIALLKAILHIINAKDTFIISCTKGSEAGKNMPQSVQNKIKKTNKTNKQTKQKTKQGKKYTIGTVLKIHHRYSSKIDKSWNNRQIRYFNCLYGNDIHNGQQT